MAVVVVLADGKEIHYSISKTEMDGLELLPANKNLIGVNRELF
jgi:hypothetical protein